MKVFVSSLISGMEAERAAVRRAIEMLGHQPVMAEDFGARAMSPQVACLSGVREADLIVLVLGLRYGAEQPSGLSATHEEFNEAQGRKPILSFVQDGDPEPDQVILIRETGGWERGLFRDTFSDPVELGEKVVRAFHNHVVATVSAPVSPESLHARVVEMLPPVRDDGGTPMLELAIASGPAQAVLRPAQIEDDALAREMQQRALFGAPPLFDLHVGTTHGLDGDALFIEQEARRGDGARISLWPSADILVRVPTGRSSSGTGFPAIIQEDVAAKLAGAMSYITWLLDHIDSTQRVTHVALGARVVGGGAFGWRTEREHAASPNSGQMVGFGRDDDRGLPVTLSPAHMPRQALTMNSARLREDLIALLRRRWTRM